MARPSFPSLGLRTQDIPPISEEQLSATASPARGRDMKMALLKNLRAPPLVHIWEFIHERQGGKSGSTQPQESEYAANLSTLAEVADIKEFWQVFNNFDVSTLPRSDAVHLFHKGTPPIWEHKNNQDGGALNLRVSKDKAPAVWKEICMLAIGEKMQDVLREPTGRKSSLPTQRALYEPVVLIER
jgi:hypothetical protein